MQWRSVIPFMWTNRCRQPPRPLFPSVPAVAGHQSVLVRAAAYASDSGESLHCFLDGANKSYVIAASDLWLFIQASNLLPSLPTPLLYIYNIVKRERWVKKKIAVLQAQLKVAGLAKRFVSWMIKTWWFIFVEKSIFYLILRGFCFKMSSFVVILCQRG